MNILNTETRTAYPDTFTLFVNASGPRTVVFVVFGEIDAPETLRVRVYCDNDLTPGSSVYLLEDETVAADPSNLRGYQTVPIPLVDATWTARVGIDITGGSTPRSFTVVTLEL